MYFYGNGMMNFTRTALLLVVSGGLLAGCSGEELKPDDAELTSVKGTVTLDGEPLANASVQFIPSVGSGVKGTYYGTTDMAGKFELRNARGRVGAEEGQFTVVVSKFAQKDGTPLPADADSGDIAALGMEHLPPKYSDPQKSEIRATVPSGGKEDFEFPLKSK